MGNRTSSCQTVAYAGNHGLHVWQLVADILYHDGLDGKSAISIEAREA